MAKLKSGLARLLPHPWRLTESIYSVWPSYRHWRFGTVESILNRKNLPPFRSPCESKEIGCPRIEAGSFVALIAASTLLRLGVCPDLQTDAIASSITCVAA